MPRSRSAKEICREFGEDDLACRVARNREARRAKSGLHTEAPRPAPPPEDEKPAPQEERDETKRRKYLDEQIEKAGG